MGSQQHPVEKKAQTLAEVIQEMAPFFIYAAIPILITISIAYFFGTTAQ
jgi:hypothetical protein